MQAAKAEAEGKQEAFDQEIWLRTFDEENPPIEIGEEVVVEPDADLDEISEPVAE